MTVGRKYARVIERVFAAKHKSNATAVPFTRDEVIEAANDLGVKVKNFGDLIYSYRFRKELPESIRAKAPKDRQWAIVGEGDAKYCFALFKNSRLEPREGMEAVKVPTATPEIVLKYKRSEEQALLAVVRYNRLVDLFLGINTYSLQSHLRTNVKGIGQIEIDELYVGVSKSGAQYVIPVQAKGGRDKQGVSQILQDAAFCEREFPNLVPRLIAAQFLGQDRVAMLELTVSRSGVQIRKEAHYHLVPADAISDDDLAAYKRADEK